MPGFTTAAAQRIARAVRYVEDLPRNAIDRPTAPRVLAGSKFASIASTVGVRSGSSTMGKGTATLQICSADSSGNVTYTSTGITVNVYHAGTQSIPVGALVQLKVIDALFFVDVEYC